MDARERLNGLRVTTVVVELETLGGMRLPEYRGGLFRGGFGCLFRELACKTGAPTCEGCGEWRDCAYSQVFESPVDAEKAEVLRKYPNAPHPFVLTPREDRRQWLPAGERIELLLTLFGKYDKALPYFLVVLEEMGRRGRFGGRFRVTRSYQLSAISGQESSQRSAVSGQLFGCGALDGRVRRSDQQSAFSDQLLGGQPALGGLDGRVKLEFVTPLRMRTKGEYNRNPDFVAVGQALLRRLHLLTALYGDGDGDASWMKPLLRAADEAKTVRRDFRVWEWDRMSGSQGRRIEMDGVVGTMEVEGDLKEWGEVLRLGEWVQVGNGTSMGLGRYRMETIG